MKKIIPLLLILGLISACSAQPKNTAATPYTLQITQVDTSSFPEVSVYVSVRDGNNQPAAIQAGKLRLFENGVEVKPEAVSGSSEAESVNTMLLIDTSGSMAFADKLNAAKSAANDFFTRMRAADTSGIIAFDTDVRELQPLTSDAGKLSKALGILKAQGNTAFYDALAKAVDILNKVEGRKAIIALTDGMDNRSKKTAEDVLSGIGFSGLSISTIGFGVPPQSGQPADNEEGIDESVLQNIANQAGGQYAFAQDATSLSTVYDQMRRALQSEVKITYHSNLPLRDGVQRALSVALADPWQGVGGQTSSAYNPGGLVPEVASPAPWLWVIIPLAGLLVLLVIPFAVMAIKGKQAQKKKKVRIKLKD